MASSGQSIVSSNPKKAGLFYFTVRGMVNFFTTIQQYLDNEYFSDDKMKLPTLVSSSSNFIQKNETSPYVRGGVNIFYAPDLNVPPSHISLYRHIFSPDMINIDYVPMFQTEDEYNHYTNWYRNYLKKFSPGTEGLRFPAPIDREYPHCVNVLTSLNKHANSSSSKFSGIDDYWKWCEENCSGEFRVCEIIFFFEDETDAGLFRLAL